MMPPLRSLPLDRAGVVSATLLFALTAAVPLLTLASGEAAAGEAFFRAAAIFFSSILYLHIDSWVAAIAGPRRPGTLLVGSGVLCLLASLGARFVPAAGSASAVFLVAGLAALGLGLFRWLRFALRLRGRTAGAGGAEETASADGGDATEIDLARRVRRVAIDVRERLRLDAVAVVAFDRGFAPLAVATAAADGSESGALALPDVREPAVAAELRAGRVYSDGLADAAGATRERIAIAIPSGDAPIGAILAATAPGKSFEKIDVVSLESIAKSVASPLAAAVAVARHGRRTNRLRVVHEVCKRLSECLSIDELLSAAPRALVSALDHGRATVCLRSGKDLAAVSRSGGGKHLDRDDAVLASAELAKALASPRAERVRSPRRAPAGFGFFEGTMSAVIAPIRAGGEALGVAVVESSDPDGFTADEVSAAEMVSDFLAISLTNARLYANERRTVKRLQAVSETHRRIAKGLEPLELIAIAARALRDGFEADRADAVLFRPGRDGGATEAAATAAPRSQKVAATDPPEALVRRALADRKSALADGGGVVVTPILAGDAALGHLHVRAKAGGALAEDEIRSIETIADALAIAIEKARHVADLRERTSALAELRAAEALERSRLSAILGRIPDAVIVLDPLGRVELVNDAAARILPASLADGSAPLASRLPEGPLRRALEAVAAARRDGRSAPVEAEGEVASPTGTRAVRAAVQDLPGSGGLIAVLRDVTEERELARAKERLSDNLTHDLRSPMTAILGFARMMRAAESGPVTDEQAECLDRVVEQGERLLSLVDAQLDLVRLESGAARVEKSEVDVEKILSEVASGFAAAAQSRGIALTSETHGEGESEIPAVPGDPRLLYRLFANLVGNAIKFTPARGTVRVAARKAAGGVEVTVADSGIGISREDQERLFGRFVRVGAPKREASGHGLGLSIVKEIVEQHGGRIGVESDGESRGTLFRVWLPGVASAPPEKVPAAHAPRAERPPRPRRVLVLEDGERSGAVEALRMALGERGDTLRIVSSHARLGEEARAFRPHSIVVPTSPSPAAAAAILALGADERTSGIEVVRGTEAGRGA